ncbi:MAG: hypothetical protein JNM39_14665 [Bdellovibrionaceae bacterium]|nr:hypothetical protein [Pseudobdellovibrionaceae bacterium]
MRGLAICFGFCGLLLVQGGLAESVVVQARAFVDAQDDLGLRIFLKEKLKSPMAYNDWVAVRRVLSGRPNLGYDLVFAWDRHKNVKNLDLSVTNIEKAMNEADSLALAKKFDEAFAKYQIIARSIKQQGRGKIRLQNRQLYFSVLQSMARALYGAGKYAESLEVYSWIPPYYFQIRQVLFEKMWAAFRASKFDYVIGAIASQQSNYFSPYLDPESYLIKIYSMKKLCRESDIVLTLKSIQAYLKGLQNGRITYKDWSRRDLILSGIDTLTEQNASPTDLVKLVSREKREIERTRLTNFLIKNFERNRPRMISQLQKVLGYSKLALGNESSLLTQVTDLEDSQTLSGKGQEWWPATGGEEWLDEIGSHVFIGDSQCGVKK